MADEPGNSSKVAYAAHHWGAMAADPWMELVPKTPAWRQAVRRAWLRDGGSETDFERIFAARPRPQHPGTNRRGA